MPKTTPDRLNINQPKDRKQPKVRHQVRGGVPPEIVDIVRHRPCHKPVQSGKRKIS